MLPLLSRGTVVVSRLSVSALGPVAQPGLFFDSFKSGDIEHLAFNQGVAGSSPVRPVNNSLNNNSYAKRIIIKRCY